MIETRYLFTLIAACAAGFTPGRACSAQDDAEHQAVLDRIFADWERRREAMDAVEYRLKGTEMFPRGSYTDDVKSVGMLPPDTQQFPPEDRTFELQQRFVFDFAGNRMRVERRGITFFLDEAVFYPSFSINLCDSENLQCITPHEENTSPQHTPQQYQTEFRYVKPSRFGMYFMDPVYEPFFLAHGRPPLFHVNPPPETSRTGFQRFTRPIERDIFRWHADAAIDGRHCTVLRTINRPRDSGENYYEYWVDLERDSAVLRYVFNTGTLVRQFDVEHQETPHGWLPARLRWTVSWELEGETRLDRYYDVAVTEIIADPPLTDVMFHATPEPGMVVSDDRTDEERYIYGGPGMPNVNWREHRMQTLRASQEPRSSRWVAVGIVGALIATGLIVYRWRAAT